MVIGQFCETYPPMVDGVGRVTQAYCVELEKLGHQTYFVAPVDANDTHTEGIETVLYEGLPLGNLPYRLGIPALSSEYRRFSAETKFDIVHSHVPFLSGKAARKIAMAQNIPIVATFHSKYKDDFLKTTHSRALTSWVVNEIVKFYDTCDEVWAVSEGSKETLRSYGYKGPVVIMPNGTNLYDLSDSAYKKSLTKIKAREGVPFLLFVGQVDCKKNIDSVIKACSILKKQGRDFDLYIAGQGPDEKMLKGLCEVYGISGQVHFLGFISDDAFLHSLYKRADIFVFPSIYDNSPLCVREAASMKTPAILVKGTSSAECVKDGENGFLCEDSPESIAESIINALPKAKEAGLLAYDTIPVAWSDVMKQVEERYITLCEAKKRKR